MKARYTVELYDKDNDVYMPLEDMENLSMAKFICDIVGSLIKNENLVLCRFCSDGHKEPIDWCQVYDNELNKQVHCYGGIE